MARKSRYEIRVRSEFSGAHHLKGFQGGCERMHGHNWIVDVFIECAKLDKTGIGIDFYAVKDAIESILTEFDHNDLNTLIQFQKKNPSSENIAKYIYVKLKRKLNKRNTRVTKVGVSETQNFGVFYWEE